MAADNTAVCIMLIATLEREMNILKAAFTQANIKVIVSKADYSSYLKLQQYMPDVILIEMPRLNTNELHFSEQVRIHKKTRGIPIIGYANEVDETLIGGLFKKGVSRYFNRPLKFSVLLNTIDVYLKQKNKARIVVPTVATDKEEDIKAILDPQTLATKKIDIMVSHVAKMLAFPFTATKVMSLVENERSAAGDLSKVIQVDPVISANILRVCNSVLFASLNRRISSIKDAIIRIGFQETKRIVMGMSVMKMLNPDNKNVGFDRVDFWYHSLATGLLAERLARTMGDVSTEEAFLAGLLHDFGVIVLDEFFPTIFSDLLEKATNSEEFFVSSESRMIGINHNDVAAELLTRWKLPDTVVQAIVHSKNFHKFKEGLDSPAKKIATCVGMGEIIAKNLVLGKECDQYILPVDPWFFSAVRMPAGISKVLMEAIYHEMDVYHRFLGLEKRDYINAVQELDENESKRIGVINIWNTPVVPPLLYLQKEGHTAHLILPKEKLTTYDKQFDCIIVWAGAVQDFKTITPFLNVVKYSEEEVQTEQKPEYCPVLTFIDPGSSIHKAPEVARMSFMYTSFDLRMLDRAIGLICKGEIVALDDKKQNSIPEPVTMAYEKPVDPAPGPAQQGSSIKPVDPVKQEGSTQGKEMVKPVETAPASNIHSKSKAGAPPAATALPAKT